MGDIGAARAEHGARGSQMEFLYCSTAAAASCFPRSRLNHFCLQQSLCSALHASKINGPPWASKAHPPLPRIPLFLCSSSGGFLSLSLIWEWPGNQIRCLTH